MNIIFKERHGDLIVRIINLCSYMTTIEWVDCGKGDAPFDDAYGVPNTNLVKYIRKSIICKDVNSNEVYTIPLLDFMNNFRPYDGYVSDVIKTVEKIKNIEHEEHREDIHTLHSEQSEPNTPTAEK